MKIEEEQYSHLMCNIYNHHCFAELTMWRRKSDPLQKSGESAKREKIFSFIKYIGIIIMLHFKNYW